MNYSKMSNEEMWELIKYLDNNGESNVTISIVEYEEIIHELWERMLKTKSEYYTDTGLEVFFRKTYFEKCSNPTFNELKMYIKRIRVTMNNNKNCQKGE